MKKNNENEKKEAKKEIAKNNHMGIVIIIGIIALFFIIKSNSQDNAPHTSKTTRPETNNTVNTKNVPVPKAVTNYFSDTPEWKEFNSVIGKFKLMFPTYPVHETSNIEIPGTSIILKTDSYVSEVISDTSAYMVNITTYPSEINISDTETILEASLNAIMTSSKNKLISSGFSDFIGYKSLDYLIEEKSENMFLKGKGLIVGKTSYLLMFMYTDEYYNEENYKKFINSFQLLDVSDLDDSGWKEFVPITKSFKVLFPTDPIIETGSQELFGEVVTLNSYSSEISAYKVYSVNITKYPFKTTYSNAQIEAILKEGLNGMLLMNGSKLISSKITNFANHRAIEYLIEIKNNVVFGKKVVYFKGIRFIIGTKMYELIGIEEKQNFSEEDYNKFTNSFQLLSE